MFKKSVLKLNLCSRRLLSGRVKKPSGFEWEKQEKVLMAPFEHIHNTPSKYTALMAPCFDHWLQVPPQKFDEIQDAMHTCMTWTMLLDDIQDNSDYRYGNFSAHKAYGVGLTINAATRTFLLGQKKTAALHPSALEIFYQVHEEFFYGSGVDIYWRENTIFPTPEAYIEMCVKKSGSWFAFPVKLMQLFSNNKTDYSDLAIDVGVYYAIVDDYFNLFQPDSLRLLTPNKKRVNYVGANDITESKMTLAIIHASQFPDVAPELAEILKQRTTDLNLVNRALTLILKHGSDQYARGVLKTIDAEIREEINRLGGNPRLVEFMDGLSGY